MPSNKLADLRADDRIASPNTLMQAVGQATRARRGSIRL